METTPDDSFVVYVRSAPRPAEEPQPPEQPLLVCSSYEEARRFCRARQGTLRSYVIRYLGAVGGGD